jgi:hypothetical protein
MFSSISSFNSVSINKTIPPPPLDSSFVLTGYSSLTISGGYNVYTYLTTGTNIGSMYFNNSQALTIDLLLVGGGGAGGYNMNGGGGGAGGVISRSFKLPSGTDIVKFSIGSGGTTNIPENLASKGIDTCISFNTFITYNLTAFGGGCGYNEDGTNTSSIYVNGGSGGGAANYNGKRSPGTGVSGQGNNGGTSNPGGGGGAGTTSSFITGGNGIICSLTGVSIIYKGLYWGGGGGASNSGGSSPAGNGGLGGGGGAGTDTAAAGTGGGSALNSGSSGTNNRGGNGGQNTGGGGGAGSRNSVGGNGGSGIIIIAIPTNIMNVIKGIPQ